MDMEKELTGLAEKVREYQEREALSDAQLCKDFAQLGSTKTYKRILAGDFTELNVERQLENYRRAVELTRMRKDPGNEVVYRDFRNVRQVLLAVKEAYTERGISRLVIVEGQTGTGKSIGARVLEEEFPTTAVITEAHGGWKAGNNPLAVMLGDCLASLKLREFGKGDSAGGRGNEMRKTVEDSMPGSFGKKKEKLFDGLRERKRILVIEEAQEMGPYCLNMVKSIINQTPTVVVLLVIPTLFRRLESRAYDDAIQLTGNRLYERVRLLSPELDEVTKFLDRRGIVWANGDQEACIKKLCEKAPLFGNWQYVNRFGKKAKGVKGAVDVEEFVSLVGAVEKQMKGNS